MDRGKGRVWKLFVSDERIEETREEVVSLEITARGRVDVKNSNDSFPEPAFS